MILPTTNARRGMKIDVAMNILDGVYAAGTAPERWPAALAQLGQYYNCSCVSLLEKNLRTGQGDAFQWGIDPSGAREYLTYWLPRNEFHRRTRVWRPGHVETDRMILPKAELVRTEYYNGFLKPFEMHAMLRVPLHVEGQTLQLLSLARSEQAGEYETPDIAALQSLVGHLQRATTISRHVKGLSEALGGLSDLLERGTTGILLLSADGRVTFANAAATRTLAEATILELRNARLCARKREDDARLQRLIAGATGRLSGLGDARGGALRLASKGEEPGLTVVVGPLDGGHAASQTAPAAFVLLTNPDRGSARPLWMLRNLYGLTAAETAMAERLMKGDTPEQAAAALDVKVSTARFHLRAMFQKTDTRRQAELVRLLLSLPNI
jgi:DNA-binding CsgD family transcriptional regulator